MIDLCIHPVIWLCEQLGNTVFPVGKEILSKGDTSVDGRSSPEMVGRQTDGGVPLAEWTEQPKGTSVGSLAVCAVQDKPGEETSDCIGLSFKSLLKRCIHNSLIFLSDIYLERT